MTQEAPKRSREAPKRPRRGPLEDPNWPEEAPKSAPGGPQEVFKRLSRGSKTDPRGFGDSPRDFQNDAIPLEGAQGGFNGRIGAPKTPSSGLQENLPESPERQGSSKSFLKA